MHAPQGEGPQELWDIIAAHARIRPGKVAIHEFATGRDYTYRDFHDQIERCAHWLRTALDPVAGKRVAMLSRNSVAMLTAHYACVRARAIFQPMNWRLVAAELAFQVSDAQPSLLIYEAEFEAAAKEAAAAGDNVALVRIGPDKDEFAEALAATPEPARAPQGALIDPDKPIALLYTSGTSGKPKGVIITERMSWASNLNFSIANSVDSHSIFLCDMPLFHVAGLMAACRVPLLVGGKVLLSQGFDKATTYQRLIDPALGVTHYFCVTQMAQMLRQAPNFDGAKMAKLTALIQGGAPNPAAVVLRWIDDGVPMSDGFGMSETGSVLQMPLGDLNKIREKAGSSGVVGPLTQMRLVDENMNDVPDGTVGEIIMRGDNVTPGYWNRPEQTAKAFAGGWLHSGDAAYRDADGFYYLVDRIKDMYISGGENVYPGEVESTLAELPGVVEAVIIGVPDERWGESGCAYVHLAPGAALSEEEILTYLRSKLAKYKIPRMVLFADDIPHTASGKVQKHILKDRWLADPSLKARL